MRCHCWSEIVILTIFTVLVTIKTNNKSKDCYFAFQTFYMLTCSTVVKFPYYTYVIIERHLNITKHRKNSNYKAPTRTTHVKGPPRKHGAYRSVASLLMWSAVSARSANGGPPFSMSQPRLPRFRKVAALRPTLKDGPREPGERHSQSMYASYRSEVYAPWHWFV